LSERGTPKSSVSFFIYRLDKRERAGNSRLSNPNHAIREFMMAENKQSSTSQRGFASMDEDKQRDIARKGGESVPEEKRSQTGRKGGESVPDEKRSFSQDRELASEAGRKGGQSRSSD
jgi:general stress protein YciG